MSIFSKIFGDPYERYLKNIQPILAQINALENEYVGFSDAALKEKTVEFKSRLAQNETLDDILPEAFALVREAAKRTLQQRHFDVQLIGAFVLHQGKIAEMKTGEGKTLSATPAAYLNGLNGQGVHIVTVNDYLAKRDAVWMGQIYDALGLSVGCIVSNGSYLYDSGQDSNDKKRDAIGSFRVVDSYLRPASRREAYSADIVYGTNNEFGFDYLRDNLVLDQTEQMQRGFYYAIVDEVDSILIDEARTPLIISQPDSESSKMYQDFAHIIPSLKENVDFNTEEKLKVATLTEEGIEKLEKILKVDNIYTEKGVSYLHHLEQALRARTFFHRDKDYIVKDGQVIIVDEFTGRLLPGRRYSGGLHQAIEAQENVKVEAESKTLATITFQNYFRFYKKLSGMTGTALTSAEEFEKVYKLGVVVIPTNKPLIRKSLPDLVFKTDIGKFKAVVEEIKARYKLGQPVLVGTTSIGKNEYLGKLLQRDGIKCEILNAKQHEREGQIIAQAGKLGAVTVATNMAGRGVDIILGGNPPDSAEAEKVKNLGGLHIIGTSRHEARRIDNQLRGRSGRQGDPGSSQFFLSLEDDLLRVFGGDRIKALMDMLKIDEYQPIEAKILSGAIEKSQIKVEGMNFDLRKHLLEYDDVISRHRNRIYALRKQLLNSDYHSLKKNYLEILEKELARIVNINTGEENNYEEIYEEVRVIFPIADDLHAEIHKIRIPGEIIAYLTQAANSAYSQKEQKDGLENMLRIIRFIFLKTIDSFWSDHLEALEYLKDSVRLRAYGGKDPLVEYKTESHLMFQELQEMINVQVIRTLFKLSVNRQ